MSNFLQKERKRLGLSAAHVQASIDVSRATYTRWEGGSPIPSDKLSLLAELDFDIQYVVTGKRSYNLDRIVELILKVEESNTVLAAKQKAQLIKMLIKKDCDDVEGALFTDEHLKDVIEIIASAGI
ncbi:helix-turn-helix transcriptional regulator [Alteromonas sp. KUL49]|uniref:helix-turn-helix domain-containing protein n=1 Tax=Alteromonas sp. KUL49 TaxID=2480798 RepID=UPI00102F012C|nr:helix-turn-helix transcriptional regulator [Alteromonas sp. KUL49]TAP38746.1 XRE family transcriptional regulator [Alteromonas sp. KUL49]